MIERRQEQVRGRLTPLVFGLVRTSRQASAFATTKERVTLHVKSITKQVDFCIFTDFHPSSIHHPLAAFPTCPARRSLIH